MPGERDTPFTRREAMTTLALGGTTLLVGEAASLLTGCASTAVAPATPQPLVTPAASPSDPHPLPAPDTGTPMNVPPALAGSHSILPLPFAPGALSGLSERMITSHHENNYGGAVRNLNRAEQELSQTSADTPPFVVAALRERELTFRNSKTLHEAYFANLGGSGRRSGAIEAALSQAYGTTARWEQHLRATAMGLGGGSGWVILSLELDSGGLRTIASGHHTQSLAASVPLLVLDLYEHSYQIDFGAAVARYLDAFVANVNWDEVNRRFERAQKLSALFRGTPA